MARRHAKRMRVHEAPFQRHVAQKLLLCADVSDATTSHRRSLAVQYQRYLSYKSRANDLSRLCVAVEQLTRFQTSFHINMNETNHSKFRHLTKRTTKLLTQLSQCHKPVAVRTQHIVRTLPLLANEATACLSARGQRIKPPQVLPTRNQYVPIILSKLYHDVATSAYKEEESNLVKTTMYQVMKTFKDTNPYFYLQVVYQRPPKHVNTVWQVKASARLQAIAASMTRYVQALNRRSCALRHKADAKHRSLTGWNNLRVTMVFIQRAARHFHELMLHLYAMALGRDEKHVHAGIVSERAAKEFLQHTVAGRDRLGLLRALACSDDGLIQESYEWTPELLVYVDAWRWQPQRGRAPFGFDPCERWQEFVPWSSCVSRSQRQTRQGQVRRFDVLAEIGYKLRNVSRVWRASRLGTRRFQAMRIEEMGALEREIKGTFGAVVDLVYKMMLARWMARKRSTEWWTSLTLCDGWAIASNPDVNEVSSSLAKDCTKDYHAKRTTPMIVESTRNVHEVLGAKKRHRSNGLVPALPGFRSPTQVNFCNGFQKPASLACALVGPLVPTQSIDNDWLDDEKRRGVLLRLRDRLRWPQLLSETKSRPGIEHDWQVTCIANHVCTLVTHVMSRAEDAARHCPETSTLLRVPFTEGNPVVVQDMHDHVASQSGSNDSTLKELQESVQRAHQNVAEMLSQFDGQHASQWRHAILDIGRTTLKLLRLVAHEEIADTCSFSD